MGLVEKEKAERRRAEGDDSVAVKKKKSKAKMGMMESFRFLLTNKYLGCMCVLVVAYGLSINFTEVRARPYHGFHAHV